jgi:hypothetical protein
MASLRFGPQSSRTEKYAPGCSPRAPSPGIARDAFEFLANTLDPYDFFAGGFQPGMVVCFARARVS